MSDPAPNEEQSPEPTAASRPTSSWRGGLRRWGAVLVTAVLAFAVGRLSTGDEERAPDAEGGEGASEEGKGTVWTCSMHPQIRSDKPGKCPICGMDLIPAGDDTGGEEPGPGEIRMTERARVLARLRTEAVERLPGARHGRRLPGRVDVDETTLKTVTPWTAGRIDRLLVAYEGAVIRRGQQVAQLYSPEIYAAHQDLLVALQRVRRARQGSQERTFAEQAANAARERLELLGVPEGDLRKMETARAPWTHVPVRAAAGGTVVDRVAKEGDYVRPGQPIYRVADLRRVWVQLDAFERDLPYLSVGQHVAVEAEALPGQQLEARVAFIDPVIDPKRRTARVRLEMRNPGGVLRPGMYVEAVVHSELREAPLVIPASAPLFTGRRSVVYVEVPGAEQPTYQLKVIKLGPRIGGYYPVLAGLKEGERVVTQGAFVLDADLQIRGGISMMSVPDDTERGPWDDIVQIGAADRERLAPVVSKALAVQDALASDDLDRAKAAAGQLARAASSGAGEPPTGHAALWRHVLDRLAKAAGKLATSADIDTARAAYGHLAMGILDLLRRFGNPTDEPLMQAHCPMAFDGKGAEWLQPQGDLRNPYFGSKMLTCGSHREHVAPGGYLGGETKLQAAGGGGHDHGGM